MTALAPSADHQMPHTGYAFRGFDLPCHPTSDPISGPAPCTAQTQRPDESEPSQFRAWMLASMKARRLSLIDQAQEAKSNRQRKRVSILEAEIASLTRALLFMEASQ